MFSDGGYGGMCRSMMRGAFSLGRNTAALIQPGFGGFLAFGGVRAHFRGRWLWRDCSWEVFSFLYGDICGGGVGGCDSFSAAVVHVSGGADGEAPPAEGDD